MAMSRQRAAVTRCCLVTGAGAKGGEARGVLRRGRQRADCGAEEHEFDKNTSLRLQRQHCIYSAALLRSIH